MTVIFHLLEFTSDKLNNETVLGVVLKMSPNHVEPDVEFDFDKFLVYSIHDQFSTFSTLKFFRY